MTDRRLTDALRSLQPEVSSRSTETALGEVRSRAGRRRRRGRIAAGAAGAAAAVVVVAGIVALDLGEDQGQRVVVDAPTSTTATTAAPTTTSTSSPSTTTTTALPAPELGTFADLADGVTGLEVTTWWTGPEWWNPLWQADPAVASEMATGIVDAGGTFTSALGDTAVLRFELVDGRVVYAHIDLETGGISELDLETGSPTPTGLMLRAELTRQLRTEFNDAVGRPWEPVDLADPDHWVSRTVAELALPTTDPQELTAAVDAVLAERDGPEYERWFTELVTGDDPYLEIRWRGLGDDSARGFDARLWLVREVDGWRVDRAEDRVLCVRSQPGPPPDYGCM